jgi:hypothetical protein
MVDAESQDGSSKETKRGRRIKRSWLAWAAVGIGVATLIGLGIPAQAIESGNSSRSRTSACVPNSSVSPILGSWYAQVHFPGIPSPNKTEATVMTFSPGGGIVETNALLPLPAANSGFWKQNADCTIAVRLVALGYDAPTSGVKQVLDVHLTFALSDSSHFQSISANATVTEFDPVSGQPLGAAISIPNVSHTTAERFSTWAVPPSFPPQP